MASKSAVVFAHDPSTSTAIIMNKSPHTILRGDSEAVRARKLARRKKEILSHIKSRFKGNITCTQYNGYDQKSTFHCAKHNKTWTSVPIYVEVSKYACPTCQFSNPPSSNLTHEEFLAKLDKANRCDIRVLDRYVKGTQPLRFLCLKCAFEFTSRPANVANGSGCPRCSVTKKHHSKKYTLDGKEATYQGAEKRAVEFLVRNGIKESTIIPSGKIDPVPYKFKGVSRRYFPDFKIGKTLVEIKSIYTLLSDLDINKAKFKASKKLGPIKLLVEREEGSFYELPDKWVSWEPWQIKNFYYSKIGKTFRIFGLDPGSANFAWSVIEIDFKEQSIKVLGSGLVKNTIRSLKGAEFEIQSEAFCKEIYQIAHHFRVSRIIAERYMTRGIGGTTIELVNIMLGCISAMRRPGDTIRLIPASEWKNRWNSKSGLDLKSVYDWSKLPPHVLDATLIAYYGLFVWFGVDARFNETKTIKLVDTLRNMEFAKPPKASKARSVISNKTRNPLRGKTVKERVVPIPQRISME